MEDKKPLRVLFCIGINQNFMDAPAQEKKDVWQATLTMLRGIRDLPGVTVLGNMDDDRIMVGPSQQFPWTTYVLADVPDFDTTVAACNLFRVTPVGTAGDCLWKYARVEARIGRELVID
ncbi:IacB protein [Castellaniella caeni]|uniref:IacB protein n=1 Tax=Castellaniella caeni TaxID=266123 RepID=UPI00082EEA25|nr:IacB protein [Castellaniella caeni]